MAQGYCVKCKRTITIENGIKTHMRNEKTRNMLIDAIKGRCPHCKGTVYQILGHN